VLQFVSTNYWDDLVAGTVCLSQGYVGDLVLARKKAREAVPPRTLAIVIPTEGAMINIDVMAVPADAPHPDEAMAFINFLLRPDIIAAISNETGYANAVPASKAMINADIKSDPVIFPTGAIKEKLFTAPPPANRDYNRARNRAWARFRAG
jgi:putrescine transport system substrate-binding protein